MGTPEGIDELGLVIFPSFRVRTCHPFLTGRGMGDDSDAPMLFSGAYGQPVTQVGRNSKPTGPTDRSQLQKRASRCCFSRERWICHRARDRARCAHRRNRRHPSRRAPVLTPRASRARVRGRRHHPGASDRVRRPPPPRFFPGHRNVRPVRLDRGPYRGPSRSAPVGSRA